LIGYQAFVVPVENLDALVQEPGYVSWVSVLEDSKVLIILYHPGRLATNLVRNEGEGVPVASPDPIFAAAKTLCKVLLHECGHAMLHLEILLSRADPVRAPTLDPEHEQEAWLFAGICWSLLLGDCSYRYRTTRDPLAPPPPRPDLGFIFA